MKNEEVENVLPLFEGAVETGRIKRKSLKNWLVKSLQTVNATFYFMGSHRLCLLSIYEVSIFKMFLFVKEINSFLFHCCFILRILVNNISGSNFLQFCCTETSGT